MMTGSSDEPSQNVILSEAKNMDGRAGENPKSEIQNPKFHLSS